MLKYKLTTKNMTTYDLCRWVVGETKITSGAGELCGSGWLHYYHSPELAALLNPIHANIANPRLWEVKAEGKHLYDRGLKGGCTRMTLLREIPMPQYTSEQRVEFGIRCALKAYRGPGFLEWANAWLDGSDRTKESALRTMRTMRTMSAALAVIRLSHEGIERYAARAAESAAAAALSNVVAAADSVHAAAAASGAAYAAASGAAYAAATARIDLTAIARTLTEQEQQ
jgi:hypothetical protein